jgi:hypothetical protein
MTELRTLQQRKTDVLEALGRNFDMWVATADPAGRPHLIAASGSWDGERIVMATLSASRTAQNLAQNPIAQLALGSQDDAITISARLEDSYPAAQAPDGVAAVFEKAAGWDPSAEGEGWAFYRFRPVRIQAYRGYAELEGRDVMRTSRWLV